MDSLRGEKRFAQTVGDEMKRINKREVLKKLKPFKRKKIILQFPEGLKREALNLADFLESMGFEVKILGDLCFGACDLFETRDLLLHFGHSEVMRRKNTIYFELFEDFNFIPLIKKNLEILPEKIGLISTIQYVKNLDAVKEFLEKEGFEVLIGEGDSRVKYPGQILGCNFSAAKTVEEKVKAYLYLGNGFFHPIGVSLSTQKKVFSVGDGFSEVSADEILRQRFAQIFKARNAKNFGIILSTKKGQYRYKRAKELKRYLEERGKKAYIIEMNEITQRALAGFMLDCYVICACPRIAIDDVLRFEKPSLTASEVKLLFEDGEYEMDEIKLLC